MTRALRLTLILGTMLLGFVAFWMPEKNENHTACHGCWDGLE